MLREMESSVFVISIIVIEFSGCIFAKENSQLYSRRENIFVDHGMNQLDGLSVMQCGVACANNATCGSFSYNSAASICQLNDRHPENDSNSQLSTITGWTSYYKDKPTCEADWYHYDTSCYVAVEVAQGWGTSEAHCVTLGGHLVDILDNGEWQFLLDTFIRPSNGNYWIGLKDPDQENTLIWTSGSKGSFAPSEVDFPGTSPGFDCALAAITGWLTVACDAFGSSICEK